MQTMADASGKALLQIILDSGAESYKFYSEGDLVHGKVRVDTRLKSPRVSISFVGRAISRCTNEYERIGVHDGNSIVFRYDETLFSGEDITLLCDNDPFVTFPFKLRFPTAVEGDRAAGSRLEKNRFFEQYPGHRLPPSMGLEVSGLTQTIHYYVKARMSTTHLKYFTGEKKVMRYLNFTQSCVDPTPALSPRFIHRTTTITRRSRQLDPRHQVEGLRAQLKDKLDIHSSSEPCASFTITLHVPDTIRAGQDCDITFTVVHTDRSAEIAMPPPLHLRGLRATLKAITHTRVGYYGFLTNELEAADTQKIVLAERHWEPKNDPESPPPMLEGDGEELAVAGFTDDGRIRVGKRVIPTFKTYALAREYALVVRLWVECAGKTHDVEAASKVDVLPWPDMIAREGADEGRVAAESEERVGDVLPSYEDVVSSGPLI